ncbi:MAG: flagellar hook-associated protein FlgK [Gammaproteobacteria bacterium]|nr:flagellar hook-associated protein FlgK [Gammaproteobacteria bacterium]MBU1466742.1 flagellar hook-associated protein FlgK [Gammaproteobacteria bacterium]MBU2021040.1 flagellar hook-associated protein FlgK [Gammaproteobacteria bacterium]MBU2240593.1 flagellar hook-associated protein FlgK [Gammaproteobacteria bacterium]MBU2319995.1 flagellar hook-associated protein FlgK [Gammaproteobacteria bacterium]
MGSNLYSIGLSGLLSSNARINTTGQNTANVDTEGYSRQRTDTTSSPVGGVVLRDTSRLVDNFVSAQVRSDTSDFSYHDTYHSLLTASDSLLAEDSVSLTGYLDKAFSALQAANNDPTSPSLRQLAHSSLNNLVDQYKTLSRMVTDQENLVDQQLSTSLTDVNAITTKISDLNSKILREEGLSVSPANELRDQQELLAKDLSKYLDINAQFNDKGLMTIQLANGQPLVMDQTPTELKVIPNSLNPKKIDLVVSFGNYNVALKTERLGGSVGGLVDFRSEFSEYSGRTLGQHAISISDAMNTQNAKGLDANGNFGKDLFALGPISIYSSPDNTNKLSDISVRVSAGEASKITTDTYELTRTDDDRFAITKYDLNGKSVGQSTIFDPSIMTPDSNGYYKVADLGLDIRVGDFNTIDHDDVFRFTPTAGAAAGLSLQAKNGDALALSAPVGVSTNSDNLSDARISLSLVTNTRPDSSAFASDGSLYPSAPHKIYFTSPSSYVVRDASGVDIAAVDNVLQYTNLLEQAGLAGEAGFDVSVSSMPQQGDEFSISTDEMGPSDNFNGLALIDLQNQSLVEGKASLTKAFAGFISYVGTKTAEAAGHAESSEVIMNDSVNRRDRLSAVSLDEEAVNLMKYQQSYSASAQVVTAARTTFETLLGIMR